MLPLANNIEFIDCGHASPSISRKVPFPVRESGRHMVSWADQSKHPKQHLDRCSHFCSAHSHNQYTQAHAQTDDKPRCIGNNRLHLLLSRVMYTSLGIHLLLLVLTCIHTELPDGPQTFHTACCIWNVWYEGLMWVIAPKTAVINTAGDCTQFGDKSQECTGWSWGENLTCKPHLSNGRVTEHGSYSAKSYFFLHSH